MFIRRALSLVLAILWLWPAGLHAQSDAFLEASRRVTALYESGHYEEVIPFWRNALEYSEKEFGPNHPTTASLLDALAQTHHAQGGYVDAEPFYKRALAIREKALGPWHPYVADSLENYASLLRETGRDTEAEEMEARAEALRRAMLKLMTDNENPYYAHPMFWAPFVVVGEGGTHTSQ